jgi:SAM-dependent methyltransferase
VDGKTEELRAAHDVLAEWYVKHLDGVLHPDFIFDVADLRALPFEDASLAGVVCWYSLIFLAPTDREVAFGELARVVKSGGYLVTASKAGDGQLRRGGGMAGLGVAYDGYWLSPEEMEARVTDAGFATVFRDSQPADELCCYLLARRT